MQGHSMIAKSVAIFFRQGFRHRREPKALVGVSGVSFQDEHMGFFGVQIDVFRCALPCDGLRPS